MRFILFGLLLLTAACRRPSSQFAAMLTPANQPADYTRYLKTGDELVAIGSEPTWSLTVNPSKGTVRFSVLNGDSTNTAVPERQTDTDGTFRYRARSNVSTADSGQLNVVFRPDSCVDNLSGQQYDYRVHVNFRGKNYVGCGASLRQLTLLQDNWVLTEFQGRPVAATDPKNELPHLEISLTEGRVAGSTGCNRLTGTVKADTRSILFGPLVTTKIACSGDVGERERNFLNDLRTPLAYQVGDLKLTLLRGGKPIMVFKKVD
ncbi:META domain-containing protein [Spirosoma areae]